MLLVGRNHKKNVKTVGVCVCVNVDEMCVFLDV